MSECVVCGRNHVVPVRFTVFVDVVWTVDGPWMGVCVVSRLPAVYERIAGFSLYRRTIHTKALPAGKTMSVPFTRCSFPALAYYASVLRFQPLPSHGRAMQANRRWVCFAASTRLLAK